MLKPLKKLTLQGFKSIRSLNDFELGNLNILIGANGAGKSNFVEFFSLLSAMMKEDGLKEYIEQSADSYLFGGPKKTSTINVEMTFGEGESGRKENQSVKNGYHFKLSPTKNGGFLVNEEKAFFYNEDDDKIPLSLGSGNSNPGLMTSKENIAKHTRSDICSWQVYHFHDTSDEAGFWRYQDKSHNERLRRDGSNIAPFLLRLKDKDPNAFDLIVSTIRVVLPFFKNFSLESNNEILRLDWRQKGLDDYLMRPTQLSDGAIRFICLATALLQPTPPSTIIIDEPELGLHPYAIEILAELLQSASTKMQVIVSTQSPSLLDCFDLKDLIVVDRINGASEFKRLGREELQSWLEEYSLGELWKKNILSGGPSYE